MHVRVLTPFLLLPLLPAAASARQAPLAGLDAYITQAMKDWEVPGLAIAVVRNDSVIYARGFGVRELGRPEPVDEHTLFSIASTTKAMTVAALGMLVDEGKLDWDDPVAEHLPALRLGDPWVARELTVRDLVTHRVGLERSDNLWIAGPFERDEILRRAEALPSAAGFRAQYGYNNIMFIAAGELAAAVADTSWDALLERRLFEPLGMTRTTSRMDVVAKRDNVASPHTRVDGRVHASTLRDYDNIGGAGAVFSSAHDMAQWLRFQLGGGAIDGKRLLEASTLREMHAPQTVMRIDTVAERMFPDSHFRAYGLGWFLQDYGTEKLVHHSGSLNWTRTQVGFIPERNIGVVAIANLSSSTLQLALMYRVLDALLGRPERDWSAEYLELARRDDEDDEDERVAGTRPSLALEAYAGEYEHPLYGTARVALEDGTLVLHYAPDYIADLEHWHYDTFRGAWRRDGFGSDFVTFTLDARGRVASLRLAGFGSFRRPAAR